MQVVLRLSAFAFLLAGLAVGGYVWGIPVEVAQVSAMDAAPDDPLALFEAALRAEALGIPERDFVSVDSRSLVGHRCSLTRPGQAFRART